MTTKELLKKEIDKMSDDQIEKIYKIIDDTKKGTVKVKKRKNIKITSHPLGGIFDHIDIRKEAYE